MDDIRWKVRESYGKIASQDGSDCCDSTLEDERSARMRYDEDDLGTVPAGANMGLGCGNPTAIADLQLGETVLDLGSGGGFDCFFAANAVGADGTVIGIDMTREMIQRARGNAASGGYGNVEFRLGEIEDLPVQNNSVDVVISNCVINLVPDKRQVFAEVCRVLKPGGRLHVSDIVTDRELPEAIAHNVEAYVGCVAGAVPKRDYIAAMEVAGLDGIRVVHEEDATALLQGCCQDDENGAGCGATFDETSDVHIISITVSAVKSHSSV